MLGSGIACLSSAFRVRKVEGWERSQNVVTSRTQAVVSVPAAMRTCASSERRATVFSEGGSLFSPERRAWKMVGWDFSAWEVSRPLLMAVSWVMMFWFEDVSLGSGGGDEGKNGLVTRF